MSPPTSSELGFDVSLAPYWQDDGLVLPPGTFPLSSPITRCCAVRGAGMGRTILQWTQPGGGFQIPITDSWHERVAIRDLTLTTTVADGDAIHLEELPGDQPRIERAVTIDRVEIRPNGLVSGGAFRTGVRLVNIWNPLLESLVVHGDTTALPVLGTSGIVLDGWSVGAVVRDPLLTHLDVGIRMAGNGEGVTIKGANCAMVRFGLLQGSTRQTPPPIGFISDFHAAALVRGIYLTSGVDALITNPLIYRHPSATGEFVGIQFTGPGWRNKVIGGNVINAAPGGPSYGLVSSHPRTQWIGVAVEDFDVPYAFQGGAVGTSQQIGCLP